MSVTALRERTAQQPTLPTFEDVPVMERRVRFSGKALLNMTFEADTAFLEGLRFGQECTVTVLCTVVRKGFVFDEGTGENWVAHAVHDFGLRVDQIVL